MMSKELNKEVARTTRASNKGEELKMEKSVSIKKPVISTWVIRRDRLILLRASLSLSWSDWHKQLKAGKSIGYVFRCLGEG